MKSSGIPGFLMFAASLPLLLSSLPLGFSYSQKPEFFSSGSVEYNITYTGDLASDFLENKPPLTMDMHIFQDNYIINLKGGRIARTFLFIGDSSRTFIVDMQEKVYYLRDYYQGDTVEEPPVAQKGKDTAIVNGIPCEVYRVKKHDGITFYYVSDKYRVNRDLFEGKNARADFLTKGLDGRIPVKKVVKKEGITITSVMARINPVTHSQAMFAIPDGFARKLRDPRK